MHSPVWIPRYCLHSPRRATTSLPRVTAQVITGGPPSSHSAGHLGAQETGRGKPFMVNHGHHRRDCNGHSAAIIGAQSSASEEATTTRVQGFSTGLSRWPEGMRPAHRVLLEGPGGEP